MKEATEWQTLQLTVNGQAVTAEVSVRYTLADFLREQLGLTGTHLGCEQGVCGACTVWLDGEPVRACLLLAVQTQGMAITTIEGLAPEGAAHPLQVAFKKYHALQCGFCTPGFLMTAAAWLRGHPHPQEAEVRDAISGNICRCTGYHNIVAAILATEPGVQLER